MKPLVAYRAAERRDVTEELVDERGRRVVEDLLRRSDLLDAPVIHDDDPIGDLERLLLVVRDEDAGHVDFVVQATEPLAKLLAHLGVERAEGLVEQQHAGLSGERARQRDPLPLPARQLRRVAILQRLQANQVQQLVDALRGSAFFGALRTRSP